MADEDLSLDEPNDGNDDATEGSGGSKKLIIIIAALVMLVLIGAGVAAYLLLGDDVEEGEGAVVTEVSESADADTTQPSDKKTLAPPKGDTIYVSMPDPLLVNITAGKRTRMMQVKINFMVRSPEAVDALKLHMPLVRNNLLDLFSTADAEEVRTREGRNKLKQEAFATAQQVLIEQSGFEAIEMLLFTDFVVQ